MPLLTDEQKLDKRIMSRLQKAIYEYRLIEEGDKILIGLSGGKDSLCLVDLLSRRMKIQNIRFSVEALHVRMENIEYDADNTYLKDFCESRGVPFHVVTTGFDARTDKRKSPCFLCSWNRRKQMFKLAQEQHFNKIALGHHMDDIVHTAMMNLYFQGSFSTMPVRLKMRKMPLSIIRPLCLECEDDLRTYAELHNYEKLKKLCPHETETHRADLKYVFAQIEEMNDEARYSVWNALEKADKLIEE